MLEVMLIRHMETKWNEEQRYIGRTDMPLSALGRDNGKKLSKYLAGERISKVFASSMKRAKETAAFIAPKSEIESLEGLREIDFGDWEGLTHAEIMESFETAMNSWIIDPAKEPIPGGEDWSNFENRVISEFDRITRTTSEGTIAIVTHAGPIKIILGNILDVASNRYWQIFQNKGAINSVRIDGDRKWIVTVNDTCYRRAR